MTIFLIVGAYLLDRLLGDPPHWPHPIRWIGQYIHWFERIVRARVSRHSKLYISGFLLCMTTVGLAWLITATMVTLIDHISVWFGYIVQLWLGFTVLASRSLNDAALEVFHALRSGSIKQSRIKLSYIVGRDTRQLDEEQIERAVVETVAENTVDGVIAPLFYLFIGGVPLAMAYKAINTLDSMVGYKNEKYAELGFISAKLDDIANWIPARLSYLFLVAAAYSLKLNGSEAARIGYRDRHNHKSPNCAWSEGAVAGAVGIRLGGPNIYFGKLVDKPWIGESTRDIARDDIVLTNRMMYRASTLAVIIFSSVVFIITALS